MTELSETYYRTRRAALGVLLADASERAAAARDECTTHYKAIEALDAERLRGLSDEEVLASEELRRWVCTLNGQEAYRRYRALQEAGLPEGLGVEGMDGRDEYYAQQLPCLRVMLQRRQPVEGLPDAVRAWAQLWTLGRPDMPIKIVEHTLSESGSWTMWWVPDTDTARVERLRYGSRQVMHDGHLADALAWVARHAWYEDPDAED